MPALRAVLVTPLSGPLARFGAPAPRPCACGRRAPGLRAPRTSSTWRWWTPTPRRRHDARHARGGRTSCSAPTAAGPPSRPSRPPGGRSGTTAGPPGASAARVRARRERPGPGATYLRRARGAPGRPGGGRPPSPAPESSRAAVGTTGFGREVAEGAARCRELGLDWRTPYAPEGGARHRGPSPAEVLLVVGPFADEPP